MGTNSNLLTVLSPGIYAVKVTSNGCFGIFSFSVDPFGCVIPLGISPDGDGINDYWDLSGFKIKQLFIYNRYGMKVYSKTEYRKEWNGQQDNGNELPDGTYFYVIERTGFDTVSGWVYINRKL